MPTLFEFALNVLERRQGLLQEERRLDQILSRRYGVTPSQLALLLSVESGGKSVGQVAAELGVIPSNITGIADRLTDCDIVTREIAPDDRRLTYLQITPKGAELLSRIRNELSTELLEELSASESG